MEDGMSSAEEDATRFKLEVMKAVGCVWPARIATDNGGTMHVPMFKRVDVGYQDDQFMVTGTFYDGKESSVVMPRTSVMSSVPAAARNVVQKIRASRQ